MGAGGEVGGSGILGFIAGMGRREGNKAGRYDPRGRLRRLRKGGEGRA